MANHLDELMLSYLDTIDTYQSLRASLGSRFSAGFLALAQANFSSPRGRYGQDFYDERMSALRGVRVTERGYGIEFESRMIDVEEQKEDDKKEEKEKREGKEGGNGENKEEDLKDAKKPDPRDPIRWFGILVPPALRIAQSEFVSSVETIIPQLLTTLSTLSSLELQIIRARTKYVYKILTAGPTSPLPDAIKLPPLDLSSGFIHLCTATQVPGVISRFMESAEKVWLLKIPYSRIEADLKWEGATQNGEGGEEFPHLFSEMLGAGEVEDVKEFGRNAEKGWEGVFEGVSWLEG